MWFPTVRRITQLLSSAVSGAKVGSGRGSCEDVCVDWWLICDEVGRPKRET